MIKRGLFRNGVLLRILCILVIVGAISAAGWEASVVMAQRSGGSEPGSPTARAPKPAPDRPSSASPAAPSSTWPSNWYSVIGAAFTPSYSSVTYVYSYVGCVLPTSGGQWRTSVNLPDKSVIKYIYVNYNNTASSSSSYAWLTRYRYDGTFTDLVAVTTRPGSSTGAGYFWDLSSEMTSTVDNLNYSYAFVWDGSTTQSLCSIQVGYYPPATGTSHLPLP